MKLTAGVSSSDLRKLVSRLRDVERKQMPYATMLALNATGEAVLEENRTLMRKVFDRPTRWTLIRDARIGALRSFAPLPGLTTPEEILADALPMLDPPSRLSVTEAAERYINVQVQGAWQGFDRSVTPYMVEPSDVTQSRLFKVVAFMGPSQSGKTMMLQTVSLHAVTCDQNPTLIVHMSRPERDKWVEEKLNQLICNSPEVYSRLGRGRDDDTFSRKRFRGMRLLIGYPTPQVLSGGTYKTVLLTDLDHMPLVLGGKDNPEGAPVRMAVQRIKSYLSRGCVLAESSPAYPVTDPGWQPDPAAPHALPPVKGGIARLYNDGTRARLYWECPDCGGEFEPRFDRLRYDDSLDPGTAGAGAEMEWECVIVVLRAPRHNRVMRRLVSPFGG
ncbi:phage terminase large subunit family protein [Rhodovulum sulfidophilum]|uniref:phage terminase large subunit family protein n=1 Tax=Rhodovulum sulfidophilum TaxID=35806 RepID=UPI000B13FFE3|nr:phage terminase large subunit family protein [Rhodovulum sulfidophilum]